METLQVLKKNMNTKPKLLITLGCSFTEGVGCYDEYTYEEVKESKEPIEILIQKYRNRNRFHELGWPNRLAKKLKYDKIINFGKGGSSTSGQLKIFIENIKSVNLGEYDVTIIWLLTEPSRFSIYANGRVVDYSSHETNIPIVNEYYKITDEFDYLCEQVFLIRNMINFCKLNNIVFYYDFWSNRIYNLYYSLWSGGNKYNDIKPFFLRTKRIHKFSEDKNRVAWDNHPNEKGYEYISNVIYNELLLKNKNIVGNSNNLECLYLGNQILEEKYIIKILGY